MYHPKHRPSIFGVASIDLFASALGAFVILTIVSLPFFMNSGKEGEAEPMEAEMRKLYRQRQTLQQQIEQLVEENERITIEDLELLLLVDFSNSYANFLDGLEYELRTLARFWEKRNKRILVSLLLYGDQKTRYPILRANIDTSDDRSNLEEITALLRRIRSESFQQNNNSRLNRDGPEALHLAINEALSFQWVLPQPQRFVFIHYDNVCYEEELENCGKNLKRLSHQVDTLFMKYTQTPISVDRQQAIVLAEENNATFIDSGQSWTLQIFSSADRSGVKDGLIEQ